MIHVFLYCRKLAQTADFVVVVVVVDVDVDADIDWCL